MSTTENEEVPSSETQASEQAAANAEETNANAAQAEGTGVADEASTSEGEDEESLDIEVEPSEGEEAAGEVEADPLAELAAKLEEAEKAKQENYDRFVRATADLENVRKRSRREVQDGRLDERGKILRDMLPVIDNLERAVEHAQQSTNDATKSIVEGVQMVLRQFQQSLERHNVKALEAVGKPFDPAVHEAVSQAPSADHPPGTVISVLQTGYMMEARLLRPALAVVSVAMPASEEGADDASASGEGEETPVGDTETSSTDGADSDEEKEE